MIKNSTIKKLDRYEIGELGLFNQGIYTYRGDIKCRVKGLKTILRTEDEVHFEGETCRWEAIKIVATNEEGRNEWAIRCFNKKKNEYETFYMVLTGLTFLK